MNLDGFREAQGRLREGMGRDVVFLTPLKSVYPDVPLGANGKPLDPTVGAESGGGYASATLHPLVINSPVTDEDISLPAGWFEEGHMVLSLGMDEDPGDATMVQTFESTWKIRDVDLDGIDIPHRRLVHVEKIQ